MTDRGLKLYPTADGRWVASDNAGWLPGQWPDDELAADSILGPAGGPYLIWQPTTHTYQPKQRPPAFRRPALTNNTPPDPEPHYHLVISSHAGMQLDVITAGDEETAGREVARLLAESHPDTVRAIEARPCLTEHPE